MTYVRRSVLGDAAAPTLAEQLANEAAVMQATADAGDQYAKDWVKANASNEYARAVQAGQVPSYITAPADQQKFASLLSTIDQSGFGSLSAEDQAKFNYLRTTGTADPDAVDAAPIGGKTTGVYAWNPVTMTGDLPPGADRIAKDIASPGAGDTPGPAVLPVASSRSSSSSSSAGSSSPAAAPSTAPSAAANYSGTTHSVGPSDLRLDIVPPAPIAADDSSSSSSSSRGYWIAGAIAGLGGVAFLASRLTHTRRR